ncbi:MAG: hypothetical protein FJ271_07965 [Planctomycetes bacterium]|nr:hypothetical protein [Planctomycetota bacterium]
MSDAPKETGSDPTLVEGLGGGAPITGKWLEGPEHEPIGSVHLGAGGPLVRFGEYELQEEIGRGGMGVVYKARHVRLNRIVALKMIMGGALADKDDLYRFETEAAAAAQLQHPGIVALYEVGTHDSQPYFSMEYISGHNLAQAVATGPLPSRLAARYLELTARAVHYAHTHGIIHRDLKPANVLLQINDGRLQADGLGAASASASDIHHLESAIPKVTDFGLAKVIAMDSGRTRTGAVLGTPSYMSPEQAAGSKSVSSASDVYSLGAILYELITSKPPFRGETTLGTLAQVADLDPILPRVLNAEVDRDLETICLKCLEKDPARRYASAEALADDLHRYLEGEPIAARRMSALRRTVRWCRRHPAAAVLLTLVLLAPLAFGVLHWQIAREERELRDLSEIRERGMRRLLYLAQVRQAHQALDQSDQDRAIDLLRRWLPRKGQDDLRDWEWYYLWDLCQGRYSLRAYQGQAVAAIYRPGHTQLISAGGPVGKPGEIRVWDADTGKPVRRWAAHANAITAIACSSDGKRLASASFDRTVHLWDPDTGIEIQKLGHRDNVRAIAFAPDGKRLASAGADKIIRLWAPDPRQASRWIEIRSWQAHASVILAIAFSPDGNWLASGGTDRKVKLWHADSGQLAHTFEGHEGEIACLAFSRIGTILVSGGGRGSNQGELRWWNVAKKEALTHHYGLSDKVLTVAMGPEGRLAAGGSDGLVRIWDKIQSSEPIVFRGDLMRVQGLAYSPDGDHLATAGGSGRVNIFNSDGGQGFVTLTAKLHAGAIAFNATGRLLAAAGRGQQAVGEVAVWDIEQRKTVASFKEETGAITALAFGKDEFLLAVAGADRNIRLLDVKDPTKAPLMLRGHADRILAVAFDAAGDRLASGCDDGSIRLWNARTGSLDRVLAADPDAATGHRNSVVAVAFSPNGRLLASGSFDKTVRVWDVDTGQSFVLSGHGGTTRAVTFSPDGSQVASASTDKTVRLWDLQTHKEHLRLEGSPGQVLSLAFHPGGRRLASVGQDSSVWIWDLVTTQEILKLDGPANALSAVAFSPGGRRLAAAGGNRIRVWEAPHP